MLTLLQPGTNTFHQTLSFVMVQFLSRFKLQFVHVLACEGNLSVLLGVLLQTAAHGR
jgi:hypothetical protein